MNAISSVPVALILTKDHAYCSQSGEIFPLHWSLRRYFGVKALFKRKGRSVNLITSRD